VHPLLLAIGSERYTPYLPVQRPAELITIANHILGTGQLSLAKFLFIAADPAGRLSTHHIEDYLRFVLERIDLRRDLHFHTETTIDTLDYSGHGLNSGSKLVLAACGNPIRSLATELPEALRTAPGITDARLIMPGVAAIRTGAYTTADAAEQNFQAMDAHLRGDLDTLQGLPLIVWADDATFTAEKLGNFLWVAFTRTNPANDIHGVASFVRNKHWGCEGPMVMDARIKPHHAPVLETDPEVEKRIDRLFAKGGSLAELG
jgi:4-hydroxy-3-polyprenylbenzoate decarboxylase